jgi:hypothetical protein
MLIVFCTIGIMASSVWAQDWAIKADYTETCSCNPACPCLFGSPSTHGYCRGNNLIEIRESYYGDVRLDGVSMITAFSLGKWLKIYIDEKASDEQAKALVELVKLDQTFGFIYAGNSKILSIEKAPLSIEKTATKVKFSVPTSMAEIEMMKGRGGKPIKILNLPVPYIDDHTQYKSITMSHKSEDKEFKHSGTNALTSFINVSGKK